MMRCKCGGKYGVTDNVHNSDTNEIYRQRKCKKCGFTIYTVEMQVEANPRFYEDWSKHHRRS